MMLQIGKMSMIKFLIDFYFICLVNSYDIPFFTAGGLFAVSAIASFLAPVAQKYKKQPESPVHIEVLTPIEENDEDEYDENDQPITMSK